MWEATLNQAESIPNFMLQLSTTKEYDTLFPEIDTRIAGLQNQLSIVQVELQNLKNTEAAMITVEAAAVAPLPSPVITPAPAAPVPIVAAAVVPTPAPIVAATVAPTPTTIVPTSVVTGQPGIAPIAEVIATPALEVAPLIAGMPTWGWILMAGAVVFFIFGGKGLEGEEGKNPRRIRRRK